jgi:hypothetical protein
MAKKASRRRDANLGYEESAILGPFIEFAEEGENGLAK